MDDLPNLPEALCLLFGLSYALHLDYPKAMKNTFDFIQRVMLGLGENKLPPKLQSLKNLLLSQNANVRLVTFGKSHLFMSGFSCFLLFTKLRHSTQIVSTWVHQQVTRGCRCTYIHSHICEIDCQSLPSQVFALVEATLNLSACCVVFFLYF